MLGVVEVFGGVLVLGGIAARYVATFQAESQMDPGVAEFDALFADMNLGARDFDLIEMGAGFSHDAPSRRPGAPATRGPTCRRSRRPRRCSAGMPSVQLSERRRCARRHTSG